MPSLTDLTQYSIRSDRQLVDSHNSLLTALNENFSYTLTQVANPIPNIATGQVGQVLAINGSLALQYLPLLQLINVSEVFDNFLQTSQLLRLGSDLAIGLRGANGTLNTLAFNATLPGGTVVDHVTFDQTSDTGDLTEEHIVNSFVVHADGMNLNATVGFINLNAVRISGYAFPTAPAVAGHILRSDGANNLEFQALPEPVLFDGDYYSLATAKPLALTATTYPELNIAAGAAKDYGFGVTEGAGIGSMYFRAAGIDVMTMRFPGGVLPPHLELQSALVLPGSAGIRPILNENPIGSIWYDSGDESIVLVAASGQRRIKSQSLKQSVNTEDVKDFALQPAATLSLAAGTTEKPAFNVGYAGFTSTYDSLKLLVSGSVVASISAAGIQSATIGSIATAKVALGTDIGLNNPAKPTYTFSDAEGLGVYRSDTDAMAIAVKGAAVIEFSKSKIDVKGNLLSNVATPLLESDAATKGYIDEKLPIGNIPGSLPIVVTDLTGGRYTQSEAKYLNGQLELGSRATPAAVRLNSSYGGAVTITAPATNNNTTFELPANSLPQGVLQLNNGKTSWVPVASLTYNAVKADGSILLTQGLSSSADTTPTAPIIGKSGAGLYVSTSTGVKVGFAANGVKLLEVNAAKDALVGRTDVFNAPYIKLGNSLSSYGTAISDGGLPTYSFAGDTSTGLGQTKVQSVGLLVAGVTRFSAGSSSLSAHNNRIEILGEPANATDAATKGYVDKVVKPRVELSFRVTSLPAGWSAGAALILSIYDGALIYQSATGSLIYESASDKTKIVVASNFSTNPDCQVYVASARLVKMAAASGVREVAFASARSIVLNYNLSVGNIVTIHLPGQ